MHLVAVLNRNHKLDISTAPTKAMSRKPANASMCCISCITLPGVAYSQTLIQNKIERNAGQIQRVSQPNRQTAMVDGVWSSDGDGEEDKSR